LQLPLRTKRSQALGRVLPERGASEGSEKRPESGRCGLESRAPADLIEVGGQRRRGALGKLENFGAVAEAQEVHESWRDLGR